LDWSSKMSTEAIDGSEPIFGLDLNGDGRIGVDPATITALSSDTAGIGLSRDSSGALYIEATEGRINVVNASGGTPSFDESRSVGSGRIEKQAFAVEGVDTNGDNAIDHYLLAVRHQEFALASDSAASNTKWQLFKISTTGVLDRVPSTASNASVNEEPFNQDLNGDGLIGNGSDAAAELSQGRVNSTVQDPNKLAAIEASADSNIVSILGPNDGNESDADTEVLVYSEGNADAGDAASELSASLIEEVSEMVADQAAEDTGVNGTVEAVTDVIDFSLKIQDTNQYGTIQTITFTIPRDSKNPRYFKQDALTGKYVLFDYNPETGEGARLESSDPSRNLNDLLRVYIRDNGQFDDDPTLGVIKDPAFIGNVIEASTPTPASGGAGNGGDTSSREAETTRATIDPAGPSSDAPADNSSEPNSTPTAVTAIPVTPGGVVRGSSGDDLFRVNRSGKRGETTVIQGGQGFDVLQLDGLGSEFTLKRLRNGRIRLQSKQHGTLILKGIEALDLTGGSTAATTPTTINLPTERLEINVRVQADGSYKLDADTGSGGVLLLKASRSSRPRAQWRDWWSSLTGQS